MQAAHARFQHLLHSLPGHGVWVVYRLLHRGCHKAYIGSTCNMRRRLREHVSRLAMGCVNRFLAWFRVSLLLTELPDLRTARTMEYRLSMQFQAAGGVLIGSVKGCLVGARAFHIFHATRRAPRIVPVPAP